MKSGYYPTPYTKINSKCIKDLNIKPEAIKISEGNMGRKLLNVILDGRVFFYLIPKGMTTRVVI